MNFKRTTLFLGTTFAITWLTHWLVVILIQAGHIELNNSLSNVLIFIGGSGPTVGAYIAVSLTTDNLKEFHSRLLKFKLDFRWYSFAIAIPILIGVSELIMEYSFNNQSFSELSIDPFYFFIPALLSSIIYGGIEELGWREYYYQSYLKSIIILEQRLL